MAGNSFGCLEAELGILRSDVQRRPVLSLNVVQVKDCGGAAVIAPLKGRPLDSWPHRLSNSRSDVTVTPHPSIRLVLFYI